MSSPKKSLGIFPTKTPSKADFMTKLIIPKKRGKIKVAIDLINQETGLLSALFTKFIPLESSVSVMNGTIEYIGVCADFKELQEAEAVPEYEAICERLDNGGYRFTFKEVTPLRHNLNDWAK